MTRSPTWFVPFLALGAVLFAQAARPQHMIRPDLIASGGGRLTGTTFSITGSVGQTAIGTLSGAYGLGAGFWFEAYSAPSAVPQVNNILPLVYALDPCFPNPSSRSTTIRFALPRTSQVSIRMYDVSGRQVRVLVDRDLEPGYHSTVLDPIGLGSGVYYYRMVADGFRQTRRLVILD